MDFVRSYFGTSEPLTSWTLLFSLFFQISTGLDKKWGKKCSTGQRFICIEVTSYKIHTLVILTPPHTGIFYAIIARRVKKTGICTPVSQNWIRWNFFWHLFLFFRGFSWFFQFCRNITTPGNQIKDPCFFSGSFSVKNTHEGASLVLTLSSLLSVLFY
jgi:hypothetical protein